MTFVKIFMLSYLFRTESIVVGANLPVFKPAWQVSNNILIVQLVVLLKIRFKVLVCWKQQQRNNRKGFSFSFQFQFLSALLPRMQLSFSVPRHCMQKVNLSHFNIKKRQKVDIFLFFFNFNSSTPDVIKRMTCL